MKNNKTEKRKIAAAEHFNAVQRATVPAIPINGGGMLLGRESSDLRCRHWTSEEESLVLKSYMAGKSIRYIRNLIGCSWSPVYSLLERKNALKPQHKKKVMK